MIIINGDLVKNFKFSIVTLIDDVERIIDNSIKAILNQTIDFEENIQLIFINNNCSDSSLEICHGYRKEYPENIVILDGENLSINDAFDHIQGEYVNFFDISDKLSDDALKNIYSSFSKHSDVDVIAIPNLTLERERRHKLNYKFTKGGEEVVDLFETPEFFNPYLNSSFIRSETAKKYRFDDSLLFKKESFFINKILIDSPKYILLDKNTIHYYIEPSEQIPVDLDEHPLKKESLENFADVYCINLIDYAIEKYGKIPQFIQHLITFEIAEHGLVSDLSDIYDADDNAFIKSLRNVLNRLDDEAIAATPKIGNPKRRFLIYLKKGKFHMEVEDGELLIKADDYLLSKSTSGYIYFDYVEKKQGFLNIAAFVKSYCDNKFVSIEAIKTNDKNEKSVYDGIYNDYATYRPNIKFLSIPWVFYYNFDIKIPVGEDENCDIKIKLNYKEGNKSFSFYPDFSFVTYCNLSAFSHYYIKDSKMVLHQNNVLRIVPFSVKKMLRFEFSSIKKILLTSRRPQFLYSIFIRVLYLLAYPFMRNRRIWLFSDRPAYADDNAKHLFKYAIEQDDGIEKYFVVEKDVPDFKAMKEISKNVIGFKTLKNKIYYLYAEKIIVSHIIDKYANPLAYRNKKLYCGLSSSDKYFLQHGVIEGDLSDRLNKAMRYLAMFLTSADLERNSIAFNHNYNFEPHRVPALGLPRHDTLSNDNVQKEILLIPTWRSYIKGEESLINSEYYHKLRNILVNERLNKKFDETGYKLVFKLHPEMYPYAEYFETGNDNVVISMDESYQELFNKCAVLITDYSTVAFDFAYLKKPVIYYQYADEYHYHKGYFDFETLGFGAVIEKEDDLMDKIINYIDDGCEMEEEYIRRVDTFFKHPDDKNNRKRVYEWIYNDE